MKGAMRSPASTPGKRSASPCASRRRASTASSTTVGNSTGSGTDCPRRRRSSPDKSRDRGDTRRKSVPGAIADSARATIAAYTSRPHRMSTTARQLPIPTPTVDAAPLRFVTAASLFDGHDAAINIMRRLIQAQGAEVVHLGHNRSVEDVVRAALQEDADGIALSSYQGGHVEYFKYMVDMLKERGAAHIRVFGGGGGTITPEEIAELQAYGVERIYHPNDGMHMGLTAMIEDVVRRAREGRDSGVGIRDSMTPGKVDLDDEIAIG